MLEIQDLLGDGRSGKEVAALLNLDYPDLVQHINKCMKPPKSQAERLLEMVNELEDAARQVLVHLTNKPTPGNQQGYARLMSEYREAVREYAKLQKPEDVVSDILQRVINPMIKDVVRSTVEELDFLKTHLTQAGVPSKTIEYMMTESFNRSIDKLKKATEPALRNLSSYFGVKGQEAVRELVAEQEHVNLNKGLN